MANARDPNRSIDRVDLAFPNSGRASSHVAGSPARAALEIFEERSLIIICKSPECRNLGRGFHVSRLITMGILHDYA